MKKYACLFAVVALCVAPALGQTTLAMRVVTTGDSATHNASGSAESVPVMVQALLGGTPTDGLALFGVNLTDAGTAGVDLCNTNAFLLTAPTSPVDIQASFDRNGGLTNPPGLGSPSITGFSGTCDGVGGLWQIGGGQNTIGNTNPPAYPTGAVILNVGNTTWATVASGTIELDGTETEDIVLTLDTGFANTLDTGGTSPFPVTQVDPGNIDVSAALTIVANVGVGCVDADVNCSGAVDAGDLIVIRTPGNWGVVAGSALNSRADVNNSGAVDAGDLIAVRTPGTWSTSTGPCNCPP